MVPVAEGVDDIFLKVFSGGLKKYASHSLMRCPMSNGRLVVVVVGGSVDRRLVRDPVMGGESTVAVGFEDGIGTKTIETVV